MGLIIDRRDRGQLLVTSSSMQNQKARKSISKHKENSTPSLLLQYSIVALFKHHASSPSRLYRWVACLDAGLGASTRAGLYHRPLVLGANLLVVAQTQGWNVEIRNSHGTRVDDDYSQAAAATTTSRRRNKAAHASPACLGTTRDCAEKLIA